jgi:hypothetical protein
MDYSDIDTGESKEVGCFLHIEVYFNLQQLSRFIQFHGFIRRMVASWYAIVYSTNTVSQVFEFTHNPVFPISSTVQLETYIPRRWLDYGVNELKPDEFGCDDAVIAADDFVSFPMRYFPNYDRVQLSLFLHRFIQLANRSPCWHDFEIVKNAVNSQTKGVHLLSFRMGFDAKLVHAKRRGGL